MNTHCQMQNSPRALTLKMKLYSNKLRNSSPMRADGIPTIPTLLKDELNTNPFLRADDISFAKTLNLEANDPVAIFAETRSRKDNF